MVAASKYLEMAPVRITASIAIPSDQAAETETDPQDAAVPGEESSDEPIEQNRSEE